MESALNVKSIDWAAVNIDQDDLDFIYNYLLENEVPMTPLELSKSIIAERLKEYNKEVVEKINSSESFYRPNKVYSEGDTIVFPSNGGIQGVVESIREGNNPDLGNFSVIKVLFDDGTSKEFASGLTEHILNTYDYTQTDKNSLDPEYVYKKYGRSISRKIQSMLRSNEDLTAIAGFWFPQALLSEVNPGYLNLAEAVMEMEEGRPVSTKEIMSQIEYPIDSNESLTEFSFNYALQKDDRFAEVGPVGKILWTLRELEPEDVRKIPMTLKYDTAFSHSNDVPNEILEGSKLYDELEEIQLAEPDELEESFDISINYPHWKAGTLPLIGALHAIFPTALETDNVTFTFRDKATGNEFPGWVIISKNYVCGLKPWYRQNGLIPGSIFRVSKGEDDGIVELTLIPPRASKDWIRSLVLDDKKRISFVTRQHHVSTAFDERMAISVENSPDLDVVWESNNRSDSVLRKQIALIFRELTKDNPQGIIHFYEIYAAINMIRRIPPKDLYYELTHDETIKQIDMLYFKIKENEEVEND